MPPPNQFGDLLVHGINDQLQRVAVRFLDFLKGRPGQDHPVHLDPRDARSVAGRELWGTVPRPDEQVGPLGRGGTIELEWDGVEGAAPSAVVERFANLVGEHSHDLHRLELLGRVLLGRQELLHRLPDRFGP